MRGYERCLAAVTGERRGLVADRIYLLEQSAERNASFINASRRESGERASVRVNCETTRNGRRLLADSVAPGQ